MRYEVKYFLPFSESEPVRFVGRGRLHLLETAAVFEGRQMRVYVPLVTTFVRPLLASASIKTVPYGVITKYRPPSLWRPRSHHVHFRDPGGQLFAIGFRVCGASRGGTRELSGRFSRYINQTSQS